MFTQPGRAAVGLAVVLSLVPVEEDSRLVPEADADLRDKYLLLRVGDPRLE